MKFGFKQGAKYLLLAIFDEWTALFFIPRKWAHTEKPTTKSSQSRRRPDPRPPVGERPGDGLPPNPEGFSKSNTTVKYSLDWWYKVFGIVGIIGGVCLVILTYLQFGITQGQIRVMQKQLYDSEMQQRAVLQFGAFTFKKKDVNTNPPAAWKSMNLPFPFIRFTLECSFTVTNVGVTPAFGLFGGGLSFPEGPSFSKFSAPWMLKRWDHKNVPAIPYGTNDLGITLIMPQQVLTNGPLILSQEWDDLTNFYIEQWISYWDIFSNHWIIGKGVSYCLTNDVVTDEFVHFSRFPDKGNTN